MIDDLHERLEKVKALYLRATTPGERRAAGDALLRIYGASTPRNNGEMTGCAGCTSHPEE